jgi:mono/diheme cytochrome c family protein
MSPAERGWSVLNLAMALLIGALGAGLALADPPGPDGAAVYKARCARCHGASGKTDTADARALKVRPLVDDAQIASMTPAELVRAIKADPKHASFGAIAGVGDAELEAAATFVKTLAKPR